MPIKATYGDFRKAIEKHHEVISRLEKKLLLKKEGLRKLKGSIETIPDGTELNSTDEADMLTVEQSSSALDPIANPEEIWPC